MPRTSTQVREPERLLQLLWDPPKRSTRTGITLTGIVTTGITIADTQGLTAVTLRRVAERLGVGTMSLYTYVPAKPELLELMIDHVLDQTYAGHDLPGETSNWQQGVRRIADTNWKDCLHHPWRAELVTSRSVIGPGMMSKYETELAPLDGIGLGDVEIDLALTSVLGMVTSAVRDQLGLDRVRTETGMSDPDWWEQVGPKLQTLMSGYAFPLSDRIGTASSISYQGLTEPRRTLDFGVEQLITGLESRIAGH